MEEDQKISLILGQTFLATGRALIDLQGGQLTLRMNKEEVKFDIYQAIKFHENTNTCQAIKFHENTNTCLRVESIDAIVSEAYKEETCGDPLEKCIMMSGSRHELATIDVYTRSKGLIDCIFAIEVLPPKNKLKQYKIFYNR